MAGRDGAELADHRFPHSPSFVVELGPGPLGSREAERHVHAILRLARALRR